MVKAWRSGAVDQGSVCNFGCETRPKKWFGEKEVKSGWKRHELAFYPVKNG